MSHKVWIVGLYLQWKTYSEIERITGHSVGAIKIYLKDFSRVVMARERGIPSAQEIGFYIGRTERLVQEYLQLIAKAEGDSQQRKRLASIKTQMRHLERQIPSKKRNSGMVWRLA
jgi:Tfp pilus assembly protein PilO